MIRESLTFVDFAGLVTDPVFYGMGVKHGDGRHVLVLPGLFGSDFYLQPLRNWLDRVGYSPIKSRLEFNAGCLNRLRSEMLPEIMPRLDGDSRPIVLIGHSRGGVLAWALANMLKERVSHLVLLGAPVASFLISIESGRATIPIGPVSRMLMRSSTLMRRMIDPDCDYPKCDCPFVRDVMLPLSPHTAVLSIHGRNDLIVPPEAQVSDTVTRFVNASHIGLAYSPEVYRALARFLAEPTPSDGSTTRWNRLGPRLQVDSPADELSDGAGRIGS
jgi:pimeloyl-ACP methyl ester carboxylesterase